LNVNLRNAENTSRTAKTDPLTNPLRTRKESAPPARRATAAEPRYTWYLSIKSVVDLLAAAVLAGVASPVIFLAAALVRLTSKGPAFYTQVRVGQGGRQFTIYKIRTMIHNCESLTGPRWSIPGDPRVTWIGHFLRRAHLDELPQLLNILRREMSLIGPRPERPEFFPELERAFPSYRDRLAVRPGVTGLAQVQLPADTDLDSVGRKLAYDLYYVQHLNPLLDLKILLCTASYALAGRIRWVNALLRLPGPVDSGVEGAVTNASLTRPRKSA
jgi:lipopolysaccharide/colanic/teichoic acid biosynthesis glycosyltransferase